MTGTAPDSTLDGVRDPSQDRHSRTGRRIALTAIALVVLVGATGFLGVHSGTASASGQGYALTVVYPKVARAGLDIPWRATVRHAGGFSGDVTLAVSAHYFDIMETQGFHPTPSQETATPDFYYLTFSKPPGDVLEVSYDAYVQPAAQLGRHAEVAVMVGGVEQVRVGFRTWLVP